MSRPFLIVAQSARMLACSVRRGGWRPVALDLFADLDTRAACHAWYRVPARDERLDPGPLGGLLERALAVHRPEGWAYGSGFDALPELIARFSRRCPLYGNRAEVARLCTRPREFFSLLDRLAIPYPEIRWSPPPDGGEASGWLVKRGGEGGRGVSVWRGGQAGAGYYQRRLPGPVFTLAFLAGCGQVWWCGFNTLYQADYNERRPFLFAGAINRACLPARTVEEVIGYARRLSSTLSLRGLAGLDFMLVGETPLVLELNPRPGAVLGLWDTAWPAGLMAAQVRACRGEPVGRAAAVPVRGFRVVFARRPIRIRPAWRWPAWCADVPPGGTEVATGAPVCSVTARGPTVAEVEARLARRAAWIGRLLSDQPDGGGEGNR